MLCLGYLQHPVARVRRIKAKPDLSLEVDLLRNFKDVLQRYTCCLVLVCIVEHRPISGLCESHAGIIYAKISGLLALKDDLSQAVQIILSGWVADITGFFVNYRLYYCVVHFGVC